MICRKCFLIVKPSFLKNYLIVLFVFAILLLLASCDVKQESSLFKYGTENDSARFYYLKGFHEILDNGRWTASEKSYRKALEFDSSYVLGKVLVGRITRNLEEREQLLQELLKEKETVIDDERLLLDVYIMSIQAFNNRDKGIKNSPEFNATRKHLAASNFRKFISKYPGDSYVKAEYIEWLHFIHGPKIALDSLKHLATDEQMKLGFYISYSASLELEIGNIEQAISISKNLKELMVDSTYTNYKKLKAEIYIAQDSLEKAKEYIDDILKIEPNHLIVLAMQSEIDKKIKNKP